ncbi:MAG: hypothetical protein MHPDNHAH_00336 [Anaerolineales bacterium]|nr:hypothetical protein [Anaerolineales bacterium]
MLSRRFTSKFAIYHVAIYKNGAIYRRVTEDNYCATKKETAC